MKTYKVHLIRHGRESAKGVVRYIGRTDLPLTAKGREELEQMVAEEPFPPVDAIYSGPLLRCRQTAEILYPHLEPVIEEGLTECDF
ncbi:MAG: histidine phosphatase family protein, partial [Clostridia bacterium]|nr:histidine phosphatase family protein [Clostridia bacterium]